ncbi:EpsG family protein [Fusobacterium nucleatum]
MKLINKKELKNVTLIFLTLFAGLRFNVGADYLSYEYLFNMIKSNQQTRMELLYWFLNKISPNYVVLCIITTFLSLYLIFKFINYLDKNNFYFILFGYFSIYYLQWNLSTIRQGLAISVFLYSTIFLFEKKYEKYLFFVLLGGLFHKSLFLAIFLYPIFKYKIKDKYLIMIFLILFVFKRELFEVLEFFILKYKISYSSYILGFVKKQLINPGVTKTYIIRALIYLFLFYLSKKKISKIRL